jgi:hypothetical protein
MVFRTSPDCIPKKSPMNAGGTDREKHPTAWIEMPQS